MIWKRRAAVTEISFDRFLRPFIVVCWWWNKSVLGNKLLIAPYYQFLVISWMKQARNDSVAPTNKTSTNKQLPFWLGIYSAHENRSSCERLKQLMKTVGCRCQTLARPTVWLYLACGNTRQYKITIRAEVLMMLYYLLHQVLLVPYWGQSNTCFSPYEKVQMWRKIFFSESSFWKLEFKKLSHCVFRFYVSCPPDGDICPYMELKLRSVHIVWRHGWNQIVQKTSLQWKVNPTLSSLSHLISL